MHVYGAYALIGHKVCGTNVVPFSERSRIGYAKEQQGTCRRSFYGGSHSGCIGGKPPQPMKYSQARVCVYVPDPSIMAAHPSCMSRSVPYTIHHDATLPHSTRTKIWM